MKEVVFSQEFVMHIGRLVLATIVYIAAARGLPNIITRINKKLRIKETYIEELNNRIKRFLGFSYIIFLVNILLYIPVVN